MDKIQKKVLLFLLNELDEQVKEWSSDEAEVPNLAEDERRWLTQMMWGFGVKRKSGMEVLIKSLV